MFFPVCCKYKFSKVILRLSKSLIWEASLANFINLSRGECLLPESIVYIATIWVHRAATISSLSQYFTNKVKLLKYLLSASVILSFCGDFCEGSVSTTTTTPCVTHGKEKTEGPMVSCRQPRLGKWRGGEKNSKKNIFLEKWQTLQNSESDDF